MNAIEKMQKEGELTEFAFDCALRRICPSAYHLQDMTKSGMCKFEGNIQNRCLLCWENALTKDYEGEPELTREECEDYLKEISGATPQARG